MARVGTLEWANKTKGGRLTLRDRLVLLAWQGVPTQFEEFADRVAGVLRHTKRTDRASPAALADSADVQTPSGPIASAAEDLCKKVYDRWLLAHCYRTYVIGALLGHGLSFDSEMFFAASMLHDIGLTEAFEQGADPSLVPGYARKDAPCFAVRGAGVAQSLASNNGWPPDKSDALAEAICLHANVRVTRSRGAVAYLLNAGSAFDVVRLRSRRLSHGTVRTIEDKWPRDNRFCDDLCAAWARETKAHPECRAAFLSSWGSFERRVRKTCPPSAV